MKPEGKELRVPNFSGGSSRNLQKKKSGRPSQIQGAAAPARTRTDRNRSGSGRKRKRRRRIRWPLIMLILLLPAGACFGVASCLSSLDPSDPWQISDAVWSHEPQLRQYAYEYGVSDYVPVLLAIMQVESGGMAEDVMQASESLGLPVNTLDTDASIQQGVKFFSELVEEARERNVDLPGVIQAYNYGRGFLQYIQENGGRYSMDLASEFGRIHSGGQSVAYENPIAVEYNGGWRWAYGNMFYYPVVEAYLDHLNG